MSTLILFHFTLGCAEIDCDEFITDSDWQLWNNPSNFKRQLLPLPFSENRQDENLNNPLGRVKSARMQGLLSSDLGYESVRKNEELSRTLLRQMIRNVERSPDFSPRSNRADSKENYHLQASYIPRLG